MDIDPDKARDVLEQLEAEKAKRVAAKIERGEVLVIGRDEWITVGPDDNIEEIEEELKAAGRKEHPGRELVFDFSFIITGVPRAGDTYAAKHELNSSGSSVLEEPAASGDDPFSGPPQPDEIEIAPSQPDTYVSVVVRHGTDEGDPGAIMEGTFCVEGGLLVVTDTDGQRVGSRPLRTHENALDASRAMLREKAGADFSRPINYPKLAIA